MDILYPKSNIFGVQPVNIKRLWGAARQYQSILGCSPSISSDFGVQPVNIKQFWGAVPQYQAILGCSPSISSDFAEIPENHAKKPDLAERIRMHRSRASGASNLSRHGLLCMALCCTLQSLVNALDWSTVAHGHIEN